MVSTEAYNPIVRRKVSGGCESSKDLSVRDGVGFACGALSNGEGMSGTHSHVFGVRGCRGGDASGCGGVGGRCVSLCGGCSVTSSWMSGVAEAGGDERWSGADAGETGT